MGGEGGAHQILVLVRADRYRLLVLVELHALVPLVLLFNAVLGPEAREHLDAGALLGLGLLLARRAADLSAGRDPARIRPRAQQEEGATVQPGVRCRSEKREWELI